MDKNTNAMCIQKKDKDNFIIKEYPNFSWKPKRLDCKDEYCGKFIEKNK